jgi:hypothetical protein
MDGCWLGRQAEQGAIAALLADARRSPSGALVIRGDAGVGKSTLLGAAKQAAQGMLLLSAQGVESESELAYAGLHQLLWTGLAQLPRLPGPQAEELGAALGLTPCDKVDRFLVSAAVLSLLAELAEEAPLLCLVDDARWLDTASAEALVFAARRLRAEPMAMLFAAREGDARRFEAPGCPSCGCRALMQPPPCCSDPIRASKWPATPPPGW